MSDNKDTDKSASILEMPFQEWQIGLERAREEFRQSVERNFPSKWFATEVCASVYAQLWIEDITQPFALIVMGHPSSKKTTVLAFFDKLDYSYLSDKFTPRSFVSHSASVKREDLHKIDLLPRICNKCFVTPELAPIFNAREDELLDNIAILTRVLDGQGFTSDSGVHGQRGYTDPTMFVWLGAIVDIPYKVWKILGNLGSRLYFLRLQADNTDEDTEIENIQHGFYMDKLKECRSHCKHFMKFVQSYPMEGLNYTHTEFSNKSVKWDKSKDSKDVLRIIVRLARLLSSLRAVVNVWETEGSGGTEYSYAAPVKENPDRAQNALYNLVRGHALTCGRTQITMDDLEIVIAVTLSSASRERTTLFDTLLAHKGECTAADLMVAMNCSKPTALKTMKELNIIGLVDEYEKESRTKPEKAVILKNEFNWFLSDEFTRLRKGIRNLADFGTPNTA